MVSTRVSSECAANSYPLERIEQVPNNGNVRLYVCVCERNCRFIRCDVPPPQSNSPTATHSYRGTDQSTDISAWMSVQEKCGDKVIVSYGFRSGVSFLFSFFYLFAEENHRDSLRQRAEWVSCIRSRIAFNVFCWWDCVESKMKWNACKEATYPAMQTWWWWHRFAFHLDLHSILNKCEGNAMCLCINLN